MKEVKLWGKSYSATQTYHWLVDAGLVEPGAKIILGDGTKSIKTKKGVTLIEYRYDREAFIKKEVEKRFPPPTSNATVTLDFPDYLSEADLLYKNLAIIIPDGAGKVEDFKKVIDAQKK